MILILLIIGAGMLFVMESGLKAKILHHHQQYAAAQLNPLTNDFGNIAKFKNPYMGNQPNDANLNANLPLANVPHTFALDSTTREMSIHYKQPVDAIGSLALRSDLVYNATANFALIDNLASITFAFQGTSYHVKKAQVRSWYGVELSELANKDAWNEAVQRKLADPAYVKKAFQALFGAAG